MGITPAAGYVTIWYAAAIGFITAIFICCFEHVNDWLNIDDGLEVFKLHGLGGACGAFLTGIFATAEISALDGIPTLASGAVDGHGIQIGYQLAEITSIMLWSFSISLIMLFGLKYIPGLHLRVSDDIEDIGLDMDQFDDECVGEWGPYDTAEGHQERRGSVLDGVHAPRAGSVNSDSTPVNEEDRETKEPKREPFPA